MIISLTKDISIFPHLPKIWYQAKIFNKLPHYLMIVMRFNKSKINAKTLKLEYENDNFQIQSQCMRRDLEAMFPTDYNTVLHLKSNLCHSSSSSSSSSSSYWLESSCQPVHIPSTWALVWGLLILLFVDTSGWHPCILDRMTFELFPVSNNLPTYPCQL